MSEPETSANGAQPAAGTSSVEGIAIGRAILWASDPLPRHPTGPIRVEEERARVERAVARAVRGVEELIRVLPRAEAELFEPEVAILNELGPLLRAKVDAGARGEDAVTEVIAQAPTDLLSDARARLLDGLAYDDRSVESLLEDHPGDRILVTEALTPSVVASLPARVVGIVAAKGESEESATGSSSHAAILARGRDIPLAFVDAAVVARVAMDAVLIVDTTSPVAAVWTNPDDRALAEAKARREALMRVRTAEDANVFEPLRHLEVEIRVNVGGLYEHVPASIEGVGLVRTELFFSNRTSPPSEAEQLSALRAIASRASGVPIVARLFDGGGDKPLAWMRAPDHRKESRGIELLGFHPELLDAQLRAFARAAKTADVRVLLPFVTSADEIDRVRARAPGLPIGAMIETPEGVDAIDSIAKTADFICIGTNDLYASMTGASRANSHPTLDGPLLCMIVRIVAGAHAHARTVTVCGEIAGDPQSARILIGAGVDILSVAARSLAKLKLSLRDVTADDCRALAEKALSI